MDEYLLKLYKIHRNASKTLEEYKANGADQPWIDGMEDTVSTAEAYLEALSTVEKFIDEHF